MSAHSMCGCFYIIMQMSLFVVHQNAIRKCQILSKILGLSSRKTAKMAWQHSVMVTHSSQTLSHTTAIYYNTHSAPTAIVLCEWLGVFYGRVGRRYTHLCCSTQLDAERFHLTESCYKLHAWVKSKHSGRSVSVNLKSSLPTHTQKTHRETKFTLRENKTSS